MARLLFPDEGNRLVYRVAGTGGSISPAVGAGIVVYADAARTTLADIAVYNGTSTPGGTISGSALTVDAFSRIPNFWGPEGLTTVYVVISAGPVTAISAKADARLADLDSRVGSLGAGGATTQVYAASFTPQNTSASFISVGTLTGNISIQPAASHGAATLTLGFTQGTAARVVTWASEYNTTWQPSPVPGSTSTITMRWSGSAWEVIATSSPAGDSTPSTLKYTSANFTASATLSSFSQARFGSAGLFSATASLSAILPATLTTYRIYAASSTGPAAATFEGAPVNLGTEFYVTSTSAIKSFWIWVVGNYPAAGAISTRLWTVSADGTTGTAVAGTDAAFGTTLPAGWNEVVLPAPVNLTTNQRYRAVTSHTDGYAGTTGYWSGTGAGASGVTQGPLVVPNAASAAGGMQGSYADGAGRLFTNLTWNGSNYWQDVSIQSGPLGPPAFGATASLSAAGGAGGSGPGVKPTADNTGIRPGSSLLTYSGTYTVSASNLTVSGLSITGDLLLLGSNITIDNCYVAGDVHVNPGATLATSPTNQTLRNCSFRTLDAEGFDRLTVDQCYIRAGQPGGSTVQLKNDTNEKAGLTATNLTLTNNFWGNIGAYNGVGQVHADALHILGVTGALIRNNVISEIPPDTPTWQWITSCVSFQGFNVSPSNITFDGNWLYGGGFYQTYLSMLNSTVTNNKLNSYFNVYQGQTGAPSTQHPGFTASFTQSGNTWDGAPVTFSLT